jgi:hypothetical protein
MVEHLAVRCATGGGRCSTLQNSGVRQRFGTVDQYANAHDADMHDESRNLRVHTTCRTVEVRLAANPVRQGHVGRQGLSSLALAG